MDILLDIEVSEISFSTGVKNNHMQGIVSQNFYLGLSFYLMSKNSSLHHIM